MFFLYLERRSSSLHTTRRPTRSFLIRTGACWFGPFPQTGKRIPSCLVWGQGTTGIWSAIAVCARHLVATGGKTQEFDNEESSRSGIFSTKCALDPFWWAGSKCNRATYGKSLLQMRVASHPTLSCTRCCRDSSVFRSLSKSWKIHIVTRAILQHSIPSCHCMLIYFSILGNLQTLISTTKIDHTSYTSSRFLYSWFTDVYGQFKNV
jgi:hypothetical protein